ncbi:hypothetical protein LWI29_025151 [Acer saccharum]|uniref:non-specific serine/threonine protein kinase n=1 Tax=Acer saccharum TaxID=4024 RepID=A0AA39TJF0_ACESA|nr:hypothetical protein LWI29_025151 [Acer saccharum]
MIVVVVVAVVLVLITVGGAVYVVRKRKYEEVYEDWEREYSPHRFSYKTLYKATKGFKDSEVIGEGGFGKVYRGVLPSSDEHVAVKKVSHDSGKQGTKQFVAEIVSMGRLRHRNLVQLRGYCRKKGELLLVYEYMPNGSLDKVLYSNIRSNLNWFQRIRILRGVACGLLYLHEGWEQVVLHRDIKAGNVLLDADLNGKLGDFGLARLYDHNSIPQTTHIVGTVGYLAPELARTGHATTSTDVYAFGAFMFEVACGRRPIELGKVDLVDCVIDCWSRGAIVDASDPRLEVVLVLITVGGAVYVVRKRKYEEVYEDWERDYSPHRFSYKTLYKATKGFKDSEVIGEGGFGQVYRGVLPSSDEQVAVKKVSHDSRKGMKQFVAEIVSMGRLRHRNLVQLRGYCRRKGELLLVYDYMPNGSLDKVLYSNVRANLNWFQRIRILRGVACGLLYLHEEWEQVVLHRDIKAGNVLLDADLNGKLGDFGLARLYDHDSIPQTTHLVGTVGYLAPELVRTGQATTSTDVYAFGAFMLEVACGRRPIELGKVYKGVLRSPEERIAIKRVTHDSGEGMKQFVAEIVSMGRLRHRNLVQLRGYCRRKGELLLVYDYMPNGSLDKILYGSMRPNLNWFQRIRIVRGVACGLLYLHEQWEQVVLHRDIKPANVLLDADLNGKLGDFGLARLYDHGSNPQTTNLVGTIGYLAPELLRTGKATTSSDVFSFGALMLEVACGRRPIEPGELDMVNRIRIDPHEVLTLWPSRNRQNHACQGGR